MCLVFGDESNEGGQKAFINENMIAGVSTTSRVMKRLLQQRCYPSFSSSTRIAILPLLNLGHPHFGSFAVSDDNTIFRLRK